MVNFNEASTLATPSMELLRILILEKRENLILAIEFYLKDKFMSGDLEGELAVMKARAWSLYLELEPWLNKSQPESQASLLACLDSGKAEDILKAVSFFNRFLYEYGLIKIDIRESINKLDLAGEDASRGL